MVKVPVILVFILIGVCVTSSFAQPIGSVQQTVVNNGIGLGSAIAVAISWTKNKSVLWAVIYGVLSWIYVLYYLIINSRSE
ncbi:hypothetical protein GCM10027592_61990 [Spirosoma flavus]